MSISLSRAIHADWSAHGPLQGDDADLGVDLFRVEPRVTEQLLDRSDIRPVVVHVGRATAAEQVNC